MFSANQSLYKYITIQNINKLSNFWYQITSESQVVTVAFSSTKKIVIK